MISRFLYHPAQVSWSNGLVLLFCFLPGPGELRAMSLVFIIISSLSNLFLFMIIIYSKNTP